MKSTCSICGRVTNYTDEFDIPVISVPSQLNKYTNIVYKKCDLCHNCYNKYKSYQNSFNYRYFAFMRLYYKIKAIILEKIKNRRK